jgi:hypothetical protein
MRPRCCFRASSFETLAGASSSDRMSLCKAEATHTRCACEGYLDRPGRASRKEGESWGIIARLSSVSIRRSCAMRLQIAEAGRGGEVRFLGEIENAAAVTAKLVRKLAAKYERLTFCYEAGPTGYGLRRQIKGLGFECAVVAPSLIPKRWGPAASATPTFPRRKR